MNILPVMEKLLQGVEVEWKALGKVCELLRGRRLVKSQLNESGDYAVFQNSMTPLGFYHESNVVSDTAFVIGAGAAGEIGYSQNAFWAADDVYYFSRSQELLNKYIYYFLLTQKAFITSRVRRASVPRLSREVIERIQIPIPPLNVQAEIVRILDAFTAYTAELTAELTARKKQYNHYRDQLLSFSDTEVEWKTLGSVLSLKAGQHISASKIESKLSNEYLYPCFGGNGIRGYVQSHSHDGDHLIIGRQGALCGNIQRAQGKFYATEHAVVVTASSEVDVSWAYHYLTVMDLNQYASQSAQPGLSVGKINSLMIPVPPMSVQKNTAAILDKFDALTASISEGLPSEIELRQKQYEYYRDRLLSFPKPNNDTAAA